MSSRPGDIQLSPLPLIALVTLISALFAVDMVGDAAINPDLATLRWLGMTILQTHTIPHALGTETFSAVGAPWIPQEWFVGILVALAERAHLSALLFVGMGLCALATLLLCLFRKPIDGRSPVSDIFVVVVVGIAMLHISFRAMGFGWLALAAMLFVIERPQKWLAIPIVVLWANLHASVVIAPVILALRTIGDLWEDRSLTRRVLQDAVLVAGAFAALFINPFGWHLLAYAAWLMQHPVRAYINEWQATNLGNFKLYACILPLGFATLYSIYRGRLSKADLLLCVTSLILAMMAIRNIPVAAIIAAPAAFYGALGKVKLRIRPSERRLEVVMASIILMTAAIIVATRARSPGGQPLPFDAVKAIASVSGGERRLYCEDWGWCSLALGLPHVRVLMDGRTDPFPVEVLSDSVKLWQADPQWRAIVKRYRINTMLLYEGSPLSRAISEDRSWVSYQRGSTYVVFILRGS
jgi:hypothetical protein